MRSVLLPGLLAAAIAGAAPAAHAVTVDELIAKYTEAVGGAARVAALQTTRFTGKFDVGGGITLDAVSTFHRPNWTRQDVSLQGLTAVQAFDGKEGWQIQPFNGRKDPERMSADDVRTLADDADIDGILIDYKKKGSKVEYLGTEDVDGTEAHKLLVTLANGDRFEVFLDPDYFLEIRRVSHVFVRGVERETRAEFGDYEKVDGVYFPFSISYQPKGAPDRQVFTVERAEVNPAVDDSAFHFPAAKPAH